MFPFKSNDPIGKLVLVQVIAWHLTGTTPMLLKQMLTHSRLHGVNLNLRESGLSINNTTLVSHRYINRLWSTFSHLSKIVKQITSTDSALHSCLCLTHSSHVDEGLRVRCYCFSASKHLFILFKYKFGSG